MSILRHNKRLSFFNITVKRNNMKRGNSQRLRLTTQQYCFSLRALRHGKPKSRNQTYCTVIVGDEATGFPSTNISQSHPSKFIFHLGHDKVRANISIDKGKEIVMSELPLSTSLKNAGCLSKVGAIEKVLCTPILYSFLPKITKFPRM